MRGLSRPLAFRLGTLVVALSAFGATGCTSTLVDARAGTGPNYLIDACHGDADGPLWVLPGTPNSNQACSGDLGIEIEGVAGTGAGGESCSIPSTKSPPFSLAWNGSGNGAGAQISASGLYETSASERQKLFQAFQGFRQDLVDLQTGGADCLLPGGAELLAERLAQAMPLPLDEVALYRYGYDTKANAVELRPGMRVRVVNAGLFGAGTGKADIPSAFTGTGVGAFAVGSAPLGTDATKLPNLALSSFLSPLGLQVDMSDGAWKPVQSVRYAASVLDLVSVDDAEPYLGLAYSPSTGELPAIDQPSVKLSENPVLVWGETPSDLVDKIELLSGGATSEACGTKGVCTIFFGRAAVVPEIAVEVDGEEVWVPVGTTLRQVIAARRDWTGPDTTPTGQLQNLLERILPPFSQGQDAGAVRVTFPRAQGNFNAGYTLRPSAFDVPLVHGDRISIGRTSVTVSGITESR